MSDRPGKWSRIRWPLGGVAAVVAVLAALLARRPGPQPHAEEPPLPPFSATPFLNTGPDAHFVGTAACAGCHRDNYRSYLLTAHSRSLSDVEPAAEPADGSFDHAASGRSYRVYRQDHQLRHQEVLRTAEGKEVSRMDLPVRYLVGSGHFTRTYLVEVDGFLHESPVTWYASRKAWDMSPGYDMPRHGTFERPVLLDCLACHAGRVEAVNGAVHRVAFHEKAIGCENCHGPGSLHQERHRSGGGLRGEDDPTIVHPGKLSRPLLESICAVCHLHGEATVYLRGRQVGDFRPGRPLTDYRLDYHLEGGNQSMTVVGHVEQLRRSACYQKSESLTCITCHNPHQREAPAERTAFYRQKCLDCHTRRPCALDEGRRRKEAADNCLSCHMPRADTDIPHVAFTHHRIGRHGPQPSPLSGGAAELVATSDVRPLAEVDRRRNLGLAYLEAARFTPDATSARQFRSQARQHLEAAQAAGLREGTTLAGLAELSWTESSPSATRFARQALEDRDAPPRVRAMALTVHSRCETQAGNFASAVGPLEELVGMRRFADDWRLLGQCYLKQGQPGKALAALQQALAIRPYRAATHAGLAEVYGLLGDTSRAAEHRDRARWLQLDLQD